MLKSPQAKKEARLAYLLILPSIVIVFSIVLLPVLSNFWISFKEIELADLRSPKPIVKLKIRKWPKNNGEELIIRYSIRNSSLKQYHNARTSSIPPVRGADFLYKKIQL